MKVYVYCIFFFKMEKCLHIVYITYIYEGCCPTLGSLQALQYMDLNFIKVLSTNIFCRTDSFYCLLSWVFWLSNVIYLKNLVIYLKTFLYDAGQHSYTSRSITVLTGVFDTSWIVQGYI